MDNWLDMARDNRKAANGLVCEDRPRSAICRAYYAAYSKVTHELLGLGVAMPVNWEGPAHRRLRPMIESRLTNMTARKRRALSEIVGKLYTMRLDADYRPSVEIDEGDARHALSLMNKVFNAF